jgi:DNA polymerase-1
MEKSKDHLAIIDGDSIAHTAEWKNTFKASKYKVDDIMQNIMDAVFASHYRLGIKGDNNFRKDLSPIYKIHRKRDLALEHRIAALLQYMVDTHGAVRAHGWEADDLCHYWAVEAIEDDDYIPVICSIDKDMQTIPGIHYNPRKDIILHISEDEADYFLNLQLLMGDNTDNIKGIPGIGIKKAEGFLAGIPYGARRQKVIETYKDFFGEKWEKELLLTGNLIYIRPSLTQEFEI